MRVLVQRVARAAVHVDAETVASIGPGLLLFVAFTTGDGDADLAWMAEKVTHLRVFEDDEGKMNRSLLEVGGQALVVSQFTCTGTPAKGGGPALMCRLRRTWPGRCSRNSLTFWSPAA